MAHGTSDRGHRASCTLPRAEARTRATGSTELKAPGEFFNVGGRWIHLLRRGAGSPVVLFESGGGQVSSTWLPALDGVAEFTTACTWDRPGYGWSQRPDAPLSLDGVCASLRALLDAAELPPPYVLIGWSLGALYVRRFAELHGDKVAGIVLLDPSHERQLEGVSALASVAMRAGSALASRAPALIGRRARPHLAAEAARLFPQLTPEERAELVRVATRPGSLRVQFAEQADVMRESRSLSVHAGALGSTPLVVLAADKMPGGSRFREHRQRVQLPELARLSTASELRYVHDADHNLPLTHAALVVDTARRLVDQWRSRSVEAPASAV